MDKQTNILKRFIIYMAILTFVMFTFGLLLNLLKIDLRVTIIPKFVIYRLKDKKYEKALKQQTLL